MLKDGSAIVGCEEARVTDDGVCVAERDVYYVVAGRFLLEILSSVAKIVGGFVLV